MPGEIRFDVRPSLRDDELNALFAASWPDHVDSTFAPVFDRSLTWIAARRGSCLVGFVNVATDGRVHAFILDTTVHPDERRRGIGRQLVRHAAEQARAAGARWLHVDYEPHLDGFYRGCGFRPCAAGLLDLTVDCPAP
jgi:GNAT superfamily N-acetyltransferase